MFDIKAYTAALTEITKAAIEKATDGLRTEFKGMLDDLSTRIGQDLEKRIADLPDAVPGKDGKDGRDGVDGKDAPIVEAKDGRDGRDGRDGLDGKDAADIVVLHELRDGSPKGTFASHRGGLWVARSKTSGTDGWECIVDGLADVELTQVDERTFSLSMTSASGAKKEKSISIPSMIYGGVFVEGKSAEYREGDCVTYGGSLWVRDASEACKRPGEGSETGWTLAVKRGRDGKQGAPGHTIRDPGAKLKVGDK